MNLTSTEKWEVKLSQATVIGNLSANNSVNLTSRYMISPYYNKVEISSSLRYIYVPTADYNQIISAIIVPGKNVSCIKNGTTGALACNCTHVND